MSRENCWEYKGCGRQPGGGNAKELGICSAANNQKAHKINNGKNGGRACWAIDDTACDNGKSSTEKLAICFKCDFYAKVRLEEGSKFKAFKDIVEYLKKGTSNTPERTPQNKFAYKMETDQAAQKILIVEDSTSLRESLAHTLQDAGYGVIEAENGQIALSKLGNKTVDLIITDLNMPVMNGIELTRALRAKSASKFTPIIFLTTESQKGKQAEAKAAGATGWIVKPFKPKQLLSVAQKVLGC